MVLTDAGGPLTIDGDLDDDGRADVTLDAGGASRVMRVTDTVAAGTPEVALDGLVITGGYDPLKGGGIARYVASRTLMSSRITGNIVGLAEDAVGTGSAIYALGSSLTISSSVLCSNQLSGNTRDYFAPRGTVLAKNGTVLVRDSLVADNIYGSLSFVGATATIEGSTILDGVSFRSSTGVGTGSRIAVAGIDQDYGSTVKVSESRIAGTYAGYGSGGSPVVLAVNAGGPEVLAADGTV